MPLVIFLIITRRKLRYLAYVMTAQPPAQRRERQRRALENSGSDRTCFVAAASCAARFAIRHAHIKTRPQRNDISSASIERDKDYDMRDNLLELEMPSPELKRRLSFGVPAVQNEPGNSLFSFDCLRNLTRQYVAREDDANRLCELLKSAEEAAERGDFAAKGKFLSSYIDEYPRRLISWTCQESRYSKQLLH
jgi:hypothetical protein